ncbi:MAG TPA: tRNA (guanosine(37)-N1)-methyltransferase TrmD, partial [Verrucomicrobiae bacterium]|nr:tRNA (guanosine(37)-N1)-methyltransferase TrmD [Verrucomicrobiae bacterium]
MDVSIMQRARRNGLVDLRVHNLRDYTHDNYKTVDDRPFGGGPGMVLKCEPIFEAVQALASERTHVILLSPAGRVFDQRIAEDLAKRPELMLICPAY